MENIKLPDYKKIVSQIKRKEVSVADGEVEDSLLWLQKSRAKFSQITRPCQAGDFVEIQFETDADHKSYQDAFILGEGKYVPGFEERIKGMKAGEEINFSLELPNNYVKKELAGSKVGFKVKMQSIQKVEMPELSDDFAKSMGEFDGLVQLRKSLEEGLQWEKEAAESRRVRQEILDNIGEAAELEIPDASIRAEQERMMELLREEVKQKLQMAFQDYLAKAHQTEDEIKEHFVPEARQRAKDSMILRAIAEMEQIKVSEEEINEGAAQFLKKHNGAKEREKNIDPQKLRAYIEDVILQEKIFVKLEEYIKIKP